MCSICRALVHLAITQRVVWGLSLPHVGEQDARALCSDGVTMSEGCAHAVSSAQKKVEKVPPALNPSPDVLAESTAANRTLARPQLLLLADSTTSGTVKEASRGSSAAVANNSLHALPAVQSHAGRRHSPESDTKLFSAEVPLPMPLGVGVGLLQPAVRLTQSSLSGSVKFIIAVGIAFVVIALLLHLLGSMVFGWLVKRRLERLDREYIGVDVHIGSLSVNPFSLCMNMEDLVIDNPAGYKTDYLLKVGNAEFDFDVWAFVRSGFRLFRVQRLVLKTVDVFVEQYVTTSNVHDVLSHLSKAKEKADSSKNKTEDALAKLALFAEALRAQIELDEVIVEDVGATMVAGNVGRLAMRMEVKDINYEEKEDGPLEVEDVAKYLLSSILKSTRASLPSWS